MDTNLTIEQIILALHNCKEICNPRQDIVVPNLSWSLLDYESDLVIVNKTGYMTEIEIKRSYTDFVADFKKRHHHDSELVCSFYYCVPKSIEEKVKAFLINYKAEHDDFDLPAILTYEEDGTIERTIDKNKPYKVGNATYYHYFGQTYNKYGKRKLFLEEKLIVARMGQLRYWKLLESMVNSSKMAKSNMEDAI